MFFRLYRGNLKDLLSREQEHFCDRPNRAMAHPTWTPRFIRQVPGALQFLHSQGIIHRDIKPANILYDLEYDGTDRRRFNFYVSDFGLSIAAQEAANQQTIAGTAFYMPPEAMSGWVTSQVFDVWSFGVTLGCILGYWCHKEMYCSREEWDRKLRGFGSTRQLVGPEYHDPQVRWSRRVQSMVDVLPPGFTKLLAPQESRASPADVLRVADFGVDLPHQKVQPSPPQSTVVLSQAQRHPNDSMSIDGLSSKGKGKGKQPEVYPSAQSIDGGSRNGPVQPPANRSGRLGPTGLPPGNQGGHAGPSRPPANWVGHLDPAFAPGTGGGRHAGPVQPPGIRGAHLTAASPPGRGNHTGSATPPANRAGPTIPVDRSPAAGSAGVQGVRGRSNILPYRPDPKVGDR